MRPSRVLRLFLGYCVASLALAGSPPLLAELRVGDICRLKGQEENTLTGMGLVVGLEGTGDSDPAAQRALARFMQLTGNVLATDEKGGVLLDDLKKTRNVALVAVTAKVPGEGGRQGGQLDCTVNAISAKSLKGGYLIPTPLQARPDEKRVYAVAEGLLTLSESGPATSAKIHQGCRLEESICNPFVKDGKITLVLDKNHAGFQTAQRIEELINLMPDFNGGSGQNLGELAKAADQVNIEVRIPEKYVANPVLFASMVLDERIPNPQNRACVVINERDGVIVVGENVEIGPVAVAHKNLNIQAGGASAGSPFVPLDTISETPSEPVTTKLKALVDALNALKVPAKDIIDIIKGLERSGDLYGRLIIE